MGMFDSFIGQIKCPNCKNQQKTEVQFKWSECLLLDYELGTLFQERKKVYMSKMIGLTSGAQTVKQNLCQMWF
ncbi:hypothetical protein ACQP3R_08325 [Bacillus inaquosorum]|uniref:hypothetical protein n=1 Tax=Bacillus inaquosorum TaxID=483913 RepID=UPI003D06D542